MFPRQRYSSVPDVPDANVSKKNINLSDNENNVPSENVESMININCHVMCIFFQTEHCAMGRSEESRYP